MWGCCANVKLGDFGKNNGFHAVLKSGENDYGQLFLLGDQIYADPLYRAWMRLVNATPRLREILRAKLHEYYLDTFSTPTINAVLSSVSTIMVVDDHEMSDEVTADGSIAGDASRDTHTKLKSIIIIVKSESNVI